MADLTVLYDGNCAFCSGSADRVRRLDRNHRIALVDLHDPAVPSRFPQVDLEEAMRLIKAVDPQGRVSSGIDAWADICHVLPGWQAAAWLLKVPGIHTLAGWGYGWIARNRYRWNRNACTGDSCAIDAPARR